jgi:hypothetical protein
MYINMERKDLHIRISSKRHEKLKAYAESREKTVTQLVEDWIDRLPSPKIDDSSITPLPNQPDG